MIILDYEIVHTLANTKSNFLSKTFFVNQDTGTLTVSYFKFDYVLQRHVLLLEFWAEFNCPVK